MIVTRSWLQEWIDLNDISTQEIVDTLNRIGLEVAEVYRLSLPKKVVLGQVVSCRKHPDADRLSVCEVDIGNERLQIVCGAKNAKYAKYVAVATIGAELPNGMKIKPTKLRGVESQGMLCASTELGLPPIEDGIMLLDESIGEMELGKELAHYPVFNDEVIDIELTANRGDCLSVLGIARELATAFGKQLRTIDIEEDNALKIGIGRLLNLEIASDLQSNLVYKAFTAKNFSNPFLIRLRLALVGERFNNRADEFGYYITHSTGVITRVYGYRFFQRDENPTITLKKDEQGFDAVYGKEKGSIIGVVQYEVSKPDWDEERFVVEASYIDPEVISKKLYQTKIESDWEFYRSSRGSEPRLELALLYLKFLLKRYYHEFMLHAGTHEVIKEVEKEAIKIDFEELDSLIGQQIDRSQIVEILKSLEFEIINVTEDSMIVRTPIFRHDIKNLQDVAEEIVRIYGIDNIEAKPLCFVEQNRINESASAFYKKKLLKTLAVGAGYFESVSFIFTQRSRLEKLGFEVVRQDLDLLNPITQELDTLRTSLVPNLLQQAIANVKNGKRRIKLFEIGTVFDTDRNERESIAFIFCGQEEPESVINHGRPKSVDFAAMVRDLGGIIGDFSLERIDPTNALMHPYQSAAVKRDGEIIGTIYKLSLPLQEKFDLPTTYIAEFDFERLDLRYPEAKPFSSFQLSFKDLSLLVDKELDYSQIKQALGDLPKEVKRFYPIDQYEDEQLGDKKSVTIRFAIQSDEKTLTEEEIASIMETILDRARERVGAQLR